MPYRHLGSQDDLEADSASDHTRHGSNVSAVLVAVGIAASILLVFSQF